MCITCGCGWTIPYAVILKLYVLIVNVLWEAKDVKKKKNDLVPRLLGSSIVPSL